ncbi:hypothetical protein B0H19DRAFT_1275388 [Mycena capillaripes]|nr:hypothetical protein B0H19DRAFT_1275388 [Mycena capillaripes]
MRAASLVLLVAYAIAVAALPVDVVEKVVLVLDSDQGPPGWKRSAQGPPGWKPSDQGPPGWKRSVLVPDSDQSLPGWKRQII